MQMPSLYRNNIQFMRIFTSRASLAKAILGRVSCGFYNVVPSHKHFALRML